MGNYREEEEYFEVSSFLRNTGRLNGDAKVGKSEELRGPKGSTRKHLKIVAEKKCCFDCFYAEQVSIRGCPSYHAWAGL